jgi:hypothetical protein
MHSILSLATFVALALVLAGCAAPEEPETLHDGTDDTASGGPSGSGDDESVPLFPNLPLDNEPAPTPEPQEAPARPASGGAAPAPSSALEDDTAPEPENNEQETEPAEDTGTSDDALLDEIVDAIEPITGLTGALG